LCAFCIDSSHAFLLLSGFAFDQRDPHAATALILVVAVSHVAMSFPNFCSVLGACSIFGNAVESEGLQGDVAKERPSLRRSHRQKPWPNQRQRQRRRVYRGKWPHSSVMWDNVGFWSRHAKVCPRIALAFFACRLCLFGHVAGLWCMRRLLSVFASNNRVVIWQRHTSVVN
jgi:hypothetical protein